MSKFLSNDDDNDNNTETNNSDSGDKPYTHEQIAKLLEYTDIRTKVIILVMASAGLRLGALPLLRVGDLIEVSI
jgi:integrase